MSDLVAENGHTMSSSSMSQQSSSMMSSSSSGAQKEESSQKQKIFSSVATKQIDSVGGQDKVAFTGEIPLHEINFIFDQNDLNKMAMQAHGTSQQETSSKTSMNSSSIEKQIGSSEKTSQLSSINLVFDGNDLSKETMQQSSNASMNTSSVEQSGASAKSASQQSLSSSEVKRSSSVLSSSSGTTTASQQQQLRGEPPFPHRAESALSDTGSSRDYYVTTPSEQERQMKEKRHQMMSSSFGKSHHSSLRSQMDMIRESFDEEMNQMARSFDERSARMMMDHDSFFDRRGRDDFFSRGHALSGGDVITSGKSNQQCFVESSTSVTENGVTRKSRDSKFFKSDNEFPSLKHSIFDVGRDNFLDPPSWSALEWNQPSSFFRRAGLRDSSRLHEERRMIENAAAAEAEAKSRMAEKERLEERERLDAVANQADRGYSSTVNPDQFEVEVDVQGFSPDELFVRTEGKKLIITAQAKQEEAVKNGNSENVFRREIKKEFDLPDDVNPYDVSSRLLPDGFLRVEAPIKNKAAISQ